MSITNSEYIQNLSDGLWGQYISGQASDLMRDSKWRGIEQLGLGLARSALQTYVNPALAPKTYQNPVTTKIQPSVRSTVNPTTQSLPQANQNILKLSLLESSSSNPLTKLQGQTRFSNLLGSYQNQLDGIIANAKQIPSPTSSNSLSQIQNGISARNTANIGTTPAAQSQTSSLLNPSRELVSGQVLSNSQVSPDTYQLPNSSQLPAAEQQARSDLQSTGVTAQASGMAGGQIAGMAAGYGMNALGSKVFGDSQGGQFATQILSQGASTAAGNVGSTIASNIASGARAGANVGSNLGSLFSNAGSMTSLGAGVVNVGLDLFDKRVKSKWENGVNIGLGLASMVPGVGPFAALGALAFNGIGHAFGGRTRSFTANQDLLAQTNGSYGGSTDKILKAQQLANTGFTLWNNSGRHDAESTLSEGSRQHEDLNRIIGYNNSRREIAQSNAGILHTGREVALAGGSNLTRTPVGKQGMVIEKNQEVSIISPTKTSTFIDLVNPINEFQQGGTINVIPDGALHARKHNMALDGVTPKGIPVVSEKEGGEIEQQAEIEKEEIIFRLEVTKKLEELAQNGSDDAAIEAGKLLVNEILYNTIDKTNNLL